MPVVGTLMPVQLNHIVVVARDKQESASFLAEILGLDVGTQVGALPARGNCQRSKPGLLHRRGS